MKFFTGFIMGAMMAIYLLFFLILRGGRGVVDRVTDLVLVSKLVLFSSCTSVV